MLVWHTLNEMKIKNLYILRFVKKNFKWESVAEYQTVEKLSKQGKLKKLKLLNRTS